MRGGAYMYQTLVEPERSEPYRVRVNCTFLLIVLAAKDLPSPTTLAKIRGRG